MIDPLIDRIDDFALRHRRLITIVGALWLIISWASNAHFIALPEIPLLTGITGVFASSGCAALWWAFINPRITKRRLARDADKSGRDHVEVAR